MSSPQRRAGGLAHGFLFVENASESVWDLISGDPGGASNASAVVEGATECIPKEPDLLLRRR